MTFCPRCGENNEDSLYCKSCGGFIGDNEEKRKMEGNVYPSLKNYPITFSYFYTESANRIELLIRIVYVFILEIITDIWGIVAGVAQLFQFFYVLIYAKKHQSAFNFIASYFRFVFRVMTYSYLITDERPPITGEDVEYPYSTSIHYESESKRLELLILYH